MLGEVTAALAVLAVAAVLAAQFATWTLAERTRLHSREDAADAAENVLEQASVLPFAELNSQWAGLQKLPAHLAARWPDGRLSVVVEPEPKQTGVKRVAVEIKWTDPARTGWAPVKLTGWFAGRQREDKK